MSQIMLFGRYPFDPDNPAAAPPQLGGGSGRRTGGVLKDVSPQGSAERMISRIISLQVSVTRGVTVLPRRLSVFFTATH